MASRYVHSDNYVSPRPSLCNCEGEYHETLCLFYDPMIDNPEVREYVQEAAELDGCDCIGNYHDSKCQVGMVEWWSSTSSRACRHYMDPFELPSGEHVYLSGWSDTPVHRDTDMVPDVGVYMDKCWMPTENFAYAVGWQDYGLPTMSDFNVVRTARHAFNHAQYGEVVELGCMGGHGRTGAFLAILCMVSDHKMSGVRAIQYVRDNHCKLAIETKAQETYISKVSGAMKRGEM